MNAKSRTSLTPSPVETESITEKAAITEDSLRQLLSQFEVHVAKRDIPEIKKFIASYVEKVIVYEKHVEVILKVPVVDLLYGGEPWLGKSTIRRRVMLRLFGEVA
ncbi:hypothetical protein BC351_33195 [Paenibacillus ferrarius]|uniref:Uncharacterized protein n=1 Tax=Paenibacillus ferrarius TaxID=1469647 RepID=A0A1V4HEJ5_9BACL|nr:hypothetical protein [Paenibacillus ferrarius]OPH52191.1 hypothetical protein BC351_33195 [Paenibacillus ferrarius]